jgi:hypothetical protein
MDANAKQVREEWVLNHDAEAHAYSVFERVAEAVE